MNTVQKLSNYITYAVVEYMKFVFAETWLFENTNKDVEVRIISNVKYRTNYIRHHVQWMTSVKYVKFFSYNIKFSRRPRVCIRQCIKSISQRNIRYSYDLSRDMSSSNGP
jgi:hypothetical protein